MSAYEQTQWGTVERVAVRDGAHLAVRRTGPSGGPQVVVLAGHGGNSREFAALAAALGAEWDVVGIDLRGAGESDWLPDDAGYSQQQFLDDLDDVFAALRLQPLAAVGVSLGGLMIMDLHARRPELFRRAVMVDIGPEFPTPDDPAAMAERMATNRALLGSTYPDARSIVEAWRETLATAWAAVPDEYVEPAALARAMRTPDGWRFACDVQGYMMRPPAETPPADHWDEWQRLVVDVPTLIVRGELSDVLSADVAAQMAEAPSASLVTIAGVGHCPPLDDPEVGALIVDWVTAARPDA
ncbi:MAG: alpha/beta hydrolase [Actinomycetota bacterium]